MLASHIFSAISTKVFGFVPECFIISCLICFYIGFTRSKWIIFFTPVAPGDPDPPQADSEAGQLPDFQFSEKLKILQEKWF